VIPAKFDYTRPSTLAEAIQALTDGGDDAKVIAGGQSLLPLLRLRLAYPDLLVDIGGLTELGGVRDTGDALEIGALTTHYSVTRDPLILEHCGLLAAAAATVADPAVRHRGTIGGSLSHADPAGDLPAVVTALDATLTVSGPAGERSIAAADFFVDYLTTAMQPGEILTAVRVPKLGADWGYRYEKFNVTAQDWAIVGVAALARRANPGQRPCRRGPDRPDQHGTGTDPGARRRAGGSRSRGHSGRADSGGRTCRRRDLASRRPARRGGLPSAPGQGADCPGADGRRWSRLTV
jgi:carbon-monoxide dehydrogenase medium subunit